MIQQSNIVRLIGAYFTPQPELHLEYMPYGTLLIQENLSYGEICMIVYQCASALAYLHGLQKPIVHRDIKPTNILVKHRSEDKIFVKLGDFGVSQYKSKSKSGLVTHCGTHMYLAPEVHKTAQRRSRNKLGSGYTTAVDVWSLGVVACQLMYGLPRYTARYDRDGFSWCQAIIKVVRKNVQQKSTDLGSLVADWMVVPSVLARLSAKDCCTMLGKLVFKAEDSSYASTPTPHLEREDQETVRCVLEDRGTRSLSAGGHQTRSTGIITSFYMIRSGAPPPSSLLSS